MLRILAVSLLLALSAPAFAIYKCESDGKTTYSQAPCPGGTALAINTAPGSDGAQARQQLDNDKREIARLEKIRHRREAEEEKAQRQAARANAARQKKCAALEMRKKWAEEDAFAAKGKAAAKARIKARRAAEKYASECG